MKAKKTIRKAAARPAPARRSIPERYFALLRGHLARPRKGTLAAAAELGRDLALARLPLEGIRGLHAEALRRLDSDFEDMSSSAFAERTAAPLMELLMAYGSASPEQLDQAGRAEEARRQSEARYRELFELSPIGIWEQDYSGAKRIIDRLRGQGVRDFRRYFREHPKALRQAVEAIKEIGVNQALLDIYRAPNLDDFLRTVASPVRMEKWGGFYEKELAALAAGESHVVLEETEKALDGSDIVTRTVTHIGEAYKDSWARVVSTVEDITERKRAEDAVRQSEARYRELFEQSPIGIWEEDYAAVKPMIDRLRKKGVRDFRRYFREHPRVLRQMEAIKEIVNVNQALLDIYRAPDKEAFLQAVTNPSRMEKWDDFYENELTALAEGESRFTLEYADKALDGSDIVTRTVTHIGEAYKDSWARVVSTIEDITERRRAEEALRESEASYRELFEQSPVSIWEEDWSAVKKMLDGLARRGVGDWRGYFRRHPDQVRKANDLIPVVEVSQATIDIYRSPSKEAIIDATLADKMSPGEIEAFREHLTAFAEGKTRFDFEVKEPALDGSEIVTYKHAVIPPKYHGDWARVIYAITDITEQKRAEEARREAERRLADIAANMPGSIFRRVLHPDGKISFPYTTIETIHGLDPKAIMEDPDVFIDAIHPDDRGKW
ncbi:MAG: PAS domain-containing protein, partial [Proteobacteria bacterium]|nr:PAS domain-containing protein [Pseudomonadota bacterium]